MAVLRQPGGVPHRGLRGDHEQGQLPEPAVERGAGLEHGADGQDCRTPACGRGVVSDEDLARISPLAYAHVIPNGTYLFDRAHHRANIVPTTLP